MQYSYIDLSRNTDGPWTNYGRMEKPDTKDYMVYDYIYKKCSEKN
jgi:hypothetical protein